VTGSVLLRAQQTAQASAGRAETPRARTSVGVAFILTLAHHTAEAWTARNITAGGA
jgi:hypothetical protein